MFCWPRPSVDSRFFELDILLVSYNPVTPSCPLIKHVRDPRYSKRAKALFEKLEVEPKPVIIEVDLRGMSDPTIAHS